MTTPLLFRVSEQKLWGVSMLLAPTLFAASSFFWTTDAYREYNPVGGTLLFLATVFWVPAFAGLFALLRPTLPRYAAWGWVVAVYGCLGGNHFGLRGLYAEAFSLSHQQMLQAAVVHPLPFNLTMYWPGPVFPLSLLVLGIQLFRKKAAPGWAAGLLALGGLAFPLSRIGRNLLVAHAADLFLLIPVAYLGWRYLSTLHPTQLKQNQPA